MDAVTFDEGDFDFVCTGGGGRDRGGGVDRQTATVPTRSRFQIHCMKTSVISQFGRGFFGCDHPYALTVLPGQCATEDRRTGEFTQGTQGDHSVPTQT